MIRSISALVPLALLLAACAGSADSAPVTADATSATVTTVPYERTSSLTRQASYIVTETCLRSSSEREAVAAWLRDHTDTRPPGVRNTGGWTQFAAFFPDDVYAACTAQSWYDDAAAEEAAARDLARVAVRNLLNDAVHHDFTWDTLPGLGTDAAAWCRQLPSFPAVAESAGMGPRQSDLAATKIVVTDADDGGIYRFRLFNVAEADELSGMWLVLAPEDVAAACNALFIDA